MSDNEGTNTRLRENYKDDSEWKLTTLGFHSVAHDLTEKPNTEYMTDEQEEELYPEFVLDGRYYSDIVTCDQYHKDASIGILTGPDEDDPVGQATHEDILRAYAEARYKDRHYTIRCVLLRQGHGQVSTRYQWQLRVFNDDKHDFGPECWTTVLAVKEITVPKKGFYSIGFTERWCGTEYLLKTDFGESLRAYMSCRNYKKEYGNDGMDISLSIPVVDDEGGMTLLAHDTNYCKAFEFTNGEEGEEEE